MKYVKTFESFSAEYEITNEEILGFSKGEKAAKGKLDPEELKKLKEMWYGPVKSAAGKYLKKALDIFNKYAPEQAKQHGVTTFKPLTEEQFVDKLAEMCVIEFGEDTNKGKFSLFAKIEAENIKKEVGEAYMNACEEAKAFVNAHISKAEGHPDGYVLKPTRKAGVGDKEWWNLGGSGPRMGGFS